MSFLSGLMGGGKAENIVDQAVDKVADVAKEKVKELMGGDTKETPKETEGGGASGGIDALAGMFSSDDKEKESGGKDEATPSSGGGEVSLTDTLGDIAKEVSGGDDKPKDSTADQVLSFGKSLFG